MRNIDHILFITWCHQRKQIAVRIRSSLHRIPRWFVQDCDIWVIKNCHRIECLFYLVLIELNVFDIFIADKILLNLFSVSYHDMITLLETIVVIEYLSAIFLLHKDILITQIFLSWDPSNFSVFKISIETLSQVIILDGKLSIFLWNILFILWERIMSYEWSIVD